MPQVEIRILPADVATRVDEIRRWLKMRGIRPTKLTSTGSAAEAVVLVEFRAAADAEEFAKEFSGTLVES